uniref:Dilute domain-containing protein n=1 Tax=Vitis vinifera TaxID=29760 RepID=F6I3M8_VITVI
MLNSHSHLKLKTDLANASLLSQTQAAEEAKQACAAAQAQNEELTTKLGDAEKKVDQLEDSVQRFGLCASPQSAGFSFLNGRVLGGLDDLRQVEAKYPALLFKQQLTAFLEKIYGMIRDNLKKEISPLLGLCIQTLNLLLYFHERLKNMHLEHPMKRRSQANAVAQQALIAHWQSIVKSLNYYLKIMKANHVPPFVVCKVFTQIFSFINVQLFNSLLLRRECCSFSNGEFVKTGLAELENWCHEATEEVISSMRVMMTEDSNNAVSSSFLLDDDSSGCLFLPILLSSHTEKFGFEGAFQSPIKVRLLSIEGVGESMNLFIIKHPTKGGTSF